MLELKKEDTLLDSLTEVLEDIKGENILHKRVINKEDIDIHSTDQREKTKGER